MISDISCVILAGGRSSRMGEDKALLPFGGFSTLAEYQYFRLSKLFKKVYISCKDCSKFDFDANFIEDIKSFDEYAPLIGIFSSLKSIKEKSLFFISVDLPFFGQKELDRLYGYKDGFDAVVPVTKNGHEPLCSIYKQDLIADIECLIDQKRFGFSNLFDNILVKYVIFDKDDAFLNLNYKAQYNQAKERLKSG